MILRLNAFFRTMTDKKKKTALNKLRAYMPFSFVATTSVCPNLLQDLYGVENLDKSRDIKELIKTTYVSFDYEKYCNNNDFINFTYESNAKACARKKTGGKTKSKYI